MARYASGTSVGVERTRSEIESLLLRFGADGFIYGWRGNQALIEFQAQNRRIRFLLPLPDKKSPEFTRTPAGKKLRSDADTLKAWEQGCRERWRSLCLLIKAKLVGIQDGISTFEDEFLAQTVLPDQSTVGASIHTAIEKMYKTGRIGRLLPALPDPGDIVEEG